MSFDLRVKRCGLASLILLVSFVPAFAQPAPAELDPNPHFEKSVELTRQQNYAQALKEVDKALELNASYYEAKGQRALIKQLTGHVDEAIKGYQEMLEVKPDDAQVHVNLGALQNLSNQPAAAESNFRQAIECNYYLLQAHYDLANLLVKQGKLNDALKEYKACLKLDPSDAMVHNNMGVIYLNRKFLEEAEDEFQKAMNLSPANKLFVSNWELVKQMKARPVEASGHPAI